MLETSKRNVWVKKLLVAAAAFFLDKSYRTTIELMLVYLSFDHLKHVFMSDLQATEVEQVYSFVFIRFVLSHVVSFVLFDSAFEAFF